MRKYLLLIMLFFLVLPSYGQWQSDDYIESCRQVRTPLDTHNLCEETLHCTYDLGQSDCFEQLILSLLEQCYATELTICEERSILYAIALNDPYYPSMDTVNQLQRMVHYFNLEEDLEDYSGSIGILQSIIHAPYYFPTYTHYLALGILYSRDDLHETAIENFSESIAIHFYNPWAFYFRARAFEAIGDEEQAARDYYTYDLLASTELKSAFPQPELSFERPEMQNWIVYPMRMTANGPGGSIEWDLSLEPAFNVQLAQLDEDATLAITSLTSESPDLMFFTQSLDNPSQYSFAQETQGISGMLGGGETIFSMTISPDYILYTIFAYGAESGSILEGILLPQTSRDPRPQLESRICPDLPLSYIQIGDEARSGSEFYPFTLGRSEPDINSEVLQIDQGVTFLVEDGPICTGEFIWWNVSFEGQTGWIPENYGNAYEVSPWGVSQLSVAELLGLSNE